MFASAAIDAIPGFAEPVSSLSHLLGAGACAVLAVRLVGHGRGDGLRLAFLAVYAISCVFLLSMSGVYHLLPPGSGRHVLARLDHSAIFVLIAGSFTPAHGILCRGWQRWVPLVGVWGAAAAGIVLKTVCFDDVKESLGLSLYLGMGWLGAGSAVVLGFRYGVAFLQPLLWGGLAYTAGGLLEFCRWPVLLPGLVGPHELFHAAVLAGIAFHWRFVSQFASGRIPAPGPVAWRPSGAQHRPARQLHVPGEAHQGHAADDPVAHVDLPPA